MQAVEEQQSLTREQKEAVGLLSIGTFLEYLSLSYSLCKLQKDIVENTIKKQLKDRGKNG